MYDGMPDIQRFKTVYYTGFYDLVLPFYILMKMKLNEKKKIKQKINKN